MTSYIALLRKDADSDYGVDFPDLPGCVTAGKTLEATRRMAEAALAFHIDGMIASGEAIPDPSGLDAIMADPANREAVGFVVQVAARPGRTVRINVTLPEDLVQEIDRVATNRSRFLAEAARQRLAAERV